jgi:hypothetical protein
LCIKIYNKDTRKIKNKINQDFQSDIKLLSNNNPIPVKEVYCTTPNDNINTNNQPHTQSYADASRQFNNTKIHEQTTNYFSKQLTSFLDDFKLIINPLISLLTTIINKLLIKNNE